LNAYIDEQHQAEQGEPRLCKNTKCNIDKYRPGCDWQRSATDGGQTRANNIAANRRRRNKCADCFADPTHPKNSSQRETIGLWEKHPPGDGIEKYRHQKMVSDHRRYPPPGCGDRSADLQGAFTDQQRHEERYTREPEQVKGKLNLARSFHLLENQLCVNAKTQSAILAQSANLRASQLGRVA
jgi:hypothetical protein